MIQSCLLISDKTVFSCSGDTVTCPVPSCHLCLQPGAFMDKSPQVNWAGLLGHFAGCPSPALLPCSPDRPGLLRSQWSLPKPTMEWSVGKVLPQGWDSAGQLWETSFGRCLMGQPAVSNPRGEKKSILWWLLFEAWENRNC